MPRRSDSILDPTIFLRRHADSDEDVDTLDPDNQQPNPPLRNKGHRPRQSFETFRNIRGEQENIDSDMQDATSSWPDDGIQYVPYAGMTTG
jgi:hypothetical protein